jgi:hypothetical protein
MISVSICFKIKAEKRNVSIQNRTRAPDCSDDAAFEHIYELSGSGGDIIPAGKHPFPAPTKGHAGTL